MVVTPTHAEAKRVTDKVRAGLLEDGAVGSQECQKNILRNLSWTEAERVDPLLYQKGFVVYFHVDAKGFEHNEKWEVRRVDKGENVALKSCSSNKRCILPLHPANRFNAYREEIIPLSEGDNIRITMKNNELKVHNGSIDKVKKIEKDGSVALESGKILSSNFRHFTHGYIVTSHASQGKTVDAMFIVQWVESFAASNREQFYVSVSRGREHIVIYTDDVSLLKKASLQPVRGNHTGFY